MKGSSVLKEGWITTEEASKLVDYAPAYIRQLAISGRIEAQKVGRDWLINQDSLLAYKAQVKPGRPKEK
jgi:excisionase family DNA binding protein